jgi:lipopolysaccharide export system protein LptC
MSLNKGQITNLTESILALIDPRSRWWRFSGASRNGERPVDYSRFVARAKFMLPLAAGAIILIMGIWPTLTTGIDRLTRHRTAVDPAFSRDFRMLNPRYTGLDKNQRPFTVTADSAREQGVNTSSGDALMALDGPKADVLSKEGAWVVVTGKTGIYQPQAHLLDLSGGVTLFHDKGYQFKTASARVDLQTSSAVGQDPISGGGPSGKASGAGFRMLQKGDIIVFTGKSHLVLNNAHASDQ